MVSDKYIVDFLMKHYQVSDPNSQYLKFEKNNTTPGSYQITSNDKDLMIDMKTRWFHRAKIAPINPYDKSSKERISFPADFANYPALCDAAEKYHKNLFQNETFNAMQVDLDLNRLAGMKHGNEERKDSANKRQR